MPKYQPVIVRKEVDDEHYYYVDGKFTPAVTRILSEAMPTPYALRQWIGEVGNDRAEAKLNKAADRGTLIHDTCEKLMNGLEINLKELFPKQSDQKVVVGFVNWFNDVKPEFKVEDIERTVASRLGFAGTLDLFCRIGGEPVIVDFKTSGGVYDSHKLQLTAYQRAFEEMTGTKPTRMILHLTPLTKKGYSVYGEDKMVIRKKPITTDDFMAVFNLYKVLNGGVVPEPDLVNVYPDTIKLFAEAK